MPGESMETLISEQELSDFHFCGIKFREQTGTKRKDGFSKLLQQTTTSLHKCFINLTTVLVIMSFRTNSKEQL